MLMTLVHMVFHLMWKITWLAKEWSNGCKRQRTKVEMILMRTEEEAKTNSTVATPKILKQMVIMLEKSPSVKSKKNIRKEFSNK